MNFKKKQEYNKFYKTTLFKTEISNKSLIDFFKTCKHTPGTSQLASFSNFCFIFKTYYFLTKFQFS